MTYKDFLSAKEIQSPDQGIDIDDSRLSRHLYEFQVAVTKRALKAGRYAIFADCGLGKTLMQLEWARIVFETTGKPVLIIAPLAVSNQTLRESELLDYPEMGIPVTIARRQEDVEPGLNITNYEMVHHFDARAFGGIVLDESSILKSFGGTYRKELTEFAHHIPYRLACTATPAPNDLLELVNHAEYLDIMIGREMIALFFTQDGNTTHAWRLKKHAVKDFWRWIAGWSIAFRSPEDLGFDGSAFVLPELRIHHHVIESKSAEGFLFPVEAHGLAEQRAAQRASLEDRIRMTADLIDDDQWLVWCNLNRESEMLRGKIKNAVEVKGSDSREWKEDCLFRFSSGDVRALVTKPSIAGHGMNWQNCSKIVFAGLSNSYEQFYQAIRRCWRFGQKRPVDVHIIISETERSILTNIMEKERKVTQMFDEIVAHMSKTQQESTRRQEMEYQTESVESDRYTMMLGDSIERMDEIDSDSIGLSVFSPPFPGMYAYTNSMRDMGNVGNIPDMIEHFRHMMTKDKLQRITMPGRLCAIHLTQIPAWKSVDGFIGIHDYRGAVIRMMLEEGWIHHGEVTIDKNPQVKASRTKDVGLLFKTLATNSIMCRPAFADYMLVFRAPGESTVAVKAGDSERYNKGYGWISDEDWIEWAAPVWYREDAGVPGGIRETDVLNVRAARSGDDERHICPLQLGVIHRAVYLWSAPNETVFSPFAGIGSEGYQAIVDGRKFVGCELKAEYYQSACKNLQQAEGQYRHRELPLFEEAERA